MVSYSTKRTSNLTEPQGIDTTFNVQYPYSNEPIKCPFFQTAEAVFDTLELIGQPGNIPATGFSLSNGYDSINQIENQTVIFIKGMGGPFLLTGQNSGIGFSYYNGSFQLSKVGQAPIPIVFLVTSFKKPIKSIKVYPNPFSGQIQIPESSLGSNFQIFDLTGKSVLSGTVQLPKLNLSSLQPGLYQLEISSLKSGERKTARIVKE
jgi:hypothetical protein